MNNMDKFLSYSEFISESLEVNLLKDASDFVAGILTAAKKKNLLKRITAFDYRLSQHLIDSLPGWAKNVPDVRFFYKNKYLVFEKIIEVDKNPVIAGLLVSNMSRSGNDPDNRYSKTNMDPAQILLISNEPMNIISIEKIFDNELLASLGKESSKFTRKTLIDNSTSKTTIDTYEEIWDRKSQSWLYPLRASEQKYFIVFEYKKEEQTIVPVTFDQVKNSSAYKDLMSSLPVEMISNPLQIKKMTIVFAIKTSHLFNVNDPGMSAEQKYWNTGCALYERGYIRNYSTTGEEHSVAGSFNATTLSGWESGLAEVKRKLEKRIKGEIAKLGILVDLKNPIDYKNLSPEIQQQLIDKAKNKELEWSKITPYISPELYNKYRGGIHSSQYGI